MVDCLMTFIFSLSIIISYFLYVLVAIESGFLVAASQSLEQEKPLPRQSLLQMLQHGGQHPLRSSLRRLSSAARYFVVLPSELLPAFRSFFSRLRL